MIRHTMTTFGLFEIFGQRRDLWLRADYIVDFESALEGKADDSLQIIRLEISDSEGVWHALPLPIACDFLAGNVVRQVLVAHALHCQPVKEAA